MANVREEHKESIRRICGNSTIWPPRIKEANQQLFSVNLSQMISINNIWETILTTRWFMRDQISPTHGTGIKAATILCKNLLHRGRYRRKERYTLGISKKSRTKLRGLRALSRKSRIKTTGYSKRRVTIPILKFLAHSQSPSLLGKTYSQISAKDKRSRASSKADRQAGASHRRDVGFWAKITRHQGVWIRIQFLTFCQTLFTLPHRTTSVKCLRS